MTIVPPRVSKQSRSALQNLRDARAGKAKRTDQYAAQSEVAEVLAETEDADDFVVADPKVGSLGYGADGVDDLFNAKITGEDSEGFSSDGSVSQMDAQNQKSVPAGQRTQRLKERNQKEAGRKMEDESKERALLQGQRKILKYLRENKGSESQGSLNKGKREKAHTILKELDGILDQESDSSVSSPSPPKRKGKRPLMEVSGQKDRKCDKVERVDVEPAVFDPQPACLAEHDSMKASPSPLLTEPSEDLKGAMPQPEVHCPPNDPAPLAERSDWTAQGRVQEPMARPADQGSNADGISLEADGSLMFYYMDGWEESRPIDVSTGGTSSTGGPLVYLFGKMKQSGGGFQSCCVVVEKMPRNAFLLCRDQPDPDDEERTQEVISAVFGEFEDMRKKGRFPLGVYKAKPVRRNYCFGKDIQHGNLLWLKVVSPPSSPPIPSSLAGETFSHVMTGSCSLLERLVVKRHLMGPSWLRLLPQGEGGFKLKQLGASKHSWAKQEVWFDASKSLKFLEVVSTEALEPPPLTVLSLSLKSIPAPLKTRGSKGGHELAVGALWWTNGADLTCAEEVLPKSSPGTWMGLRKLQDIALPEDLSALRQGEIVVESTERGLLAILVQKIATIDPDIIVGHNCFGLDLDLLSSRLAHYQVSQWHRLSRLKRPRGATPLTSNKGTGVFQGRYLTLGRVVCDTYLSAREFIKEPVYELSHLVKSRLNEERPTLKADRMKELFLTRDSSSLANLCLHTLQDAVYSLRLAWRIQALPLTRQLSNLAGNLWAHSLMSKRSERNEMLLLHEFHRKKFVTPDKVLHIKEPLADVDEEAEHGAKEPRRKKAGYSGGLVLEPKAGLYDSFVLLLDFNSLYPSIIREFNICFTTVEEPSSLEHSEPEDGSAPMAVLPPVESRQGVLPKVIARLVETRKHLKKKLQVESDPSVRTVLDIRQSALKLTANSMYGCLGFSTSRFFAKHIAALITHTGRNTLQATVNLVENKLRLNVIYGDTDSIFVDSGCKKYEEAREIGLLVVKEVNKQYRKLELDIDAVYARLLLLKKKKYAGVKVDGDGRLDPEYKGLDLVRRDWCGVSKRVGQTVLSKLLGLDEAMNWTREQCLEWLHSYLKNELSEKLSSIPVSEFVITKGLAKMPQDYPDAANQPHVQVARRLMEAGEVIRPGNEIPYVVTLPSGVDGASGGGDLSVACRARHPDEVLSQGLQLDLEWYKEQQIQPPLLRLLSVVEGAEAARIAECLGLDASKFLRLDPGKQDELLVMQFQHETLEDKYAPILHRFTVTWRCFSCGTCTSLLQLVPEKRLGCCSVASSLSSDPCVLEQVLTSLIVQNLNVVMNSALGNWAACDEVGCGRLTRSVCGSSSGVQCQAGVGSGRQCRGEIQPQWSSKDVHMSLMFLKVLLEKWNFQDARSLVEEKLQFNAYHTLNMGTLFSMYDGMRQRLTAKC